MFIYIAGFYIIWLIKSEEKRWIILIRALIWITN
jgi:hypothetical protein